MLKIMRNVVTPEMLERMKQMRLDGKRIVDIAAEVKVDQGTVSRRLRGIVRRAPSTLSAYIKKADRLKQDAPDDGLFKHDPYYSF